MKFLEKYKLFEYAEVDNQKIHKICKIYDINNYTINTDGSIDVDDDVNIDNYYLEKIPLKFNKVTGYFVVHQNILKSLNGSPKWVGGDFDCSENDLTTLKGGPEYVGGNYSCILNELTDLEGSPSKVDGDFHFFANNIISLKGAPEYIGGDFLSCDLPDGSFLNIMTLNGLPKIGGRFYYSEQSLIYNVIKLFKPVDSWFPFYDIKNMLYDFNNYYDPIKIINNEPYIVLDRLNEFLLDNDLNTVNGVKGYKLL
jgi:hypothetical protein